MSARTSWSQMIARCYDPKHPKYHRYGGRGIRVCDRWICRRLFLEDMGFRPPGRTLNRIDNDGHYSPDNCEWASYKEQARNSINSRNITFNDRTACLAEWERITGIYRKTISKRLQNGWSIEHALTTPVSRHNQSLEHTHENHNL